MPRRHATVTVTVTGCVVSFMALTLAAVPAGAERQVAGASAVAVEIDDAALPEIVGTLARLHLKPLKSVREAAEIDPLIAIAGGGGVNLYNSMGNAWTADYLKITGELDVDLRSNIAAEARAKIVYERLINFCRDAGTKDALQFLMTREITHMRAFPLALESMGKPPFSIGKIAPTPQLVDQFFNDSTGEGDHGEVDARGPWNEGEPWEFVKSHAQPDAAKARASVFASCRCMI